VNPRQSVALAAVCALALTGCAMTPTATNRSTIEQRLLARSLERAVAQIDVTALQSRAVFVELLAMTPDQGYARAFVTAELRQRGVRIVDEMSAADARLVVLAPGLGVDQGVTLIGVPPMTVPVVGIPVPEVALFKQVRHHGFTEVKVYGYDTRDGRPFETVSTGIGQSKYHQFTLLILIKWTQDDLDEPPAALPAAAR
jgi:hypothetical protein